RLANLCLASYCPSVSTSSPGATQVRLPRLARVTRGFFVRVPSKAPIPASDNSARRYEDGVRAGVLVLECQVTVCTDETSTDAVQLVLIGRMRPAWPLLQTHTI